MADVQDKKRYNKIILLKEAVTGKKNYPRKSKILFWIFGDEKLHKWQRHGVRRKDKKQ
jgi:hypothetical protein